MGEPACIKNPQASMSKLLPDVVINDVIVIYEIESVPRQELHLLQFHDLLLKYGYRQWLVGVNGSGQHRSVALPTTFNP